jgi:hypothetical protein
MCVFEKVQLDKVLVASTRARVEAEKLRADGVKHPPCSVRLESRTRLALLENLDDLTWAMKERCVSARWWDQGDKKNKEMRARVGVCVCVCVCARAHYTNAHLCLVCLVSLQPRIESLGVVNAVDCLGARNVNVVLELVEEPFGWHVAAREEVSGHPTFIELVRRPVRRVTDQRRARECTSVCE